jgi:hypothetical protein
VRVVSAVLVSVALAGAAVASGDAAVPPAQIRVTPASGGVRTVFTVRFRAPDKTGVQGRTRRFDLLSAAAPAGAPTAGCLTAIDVSLPPASSGSRVLVRLDARSRASRWCVGTYHGQVEELEGPVCPHGVACPAFVALLGTIGRFAFVVRGPAGGPPPPSGAGTPPSFGGLRSAFACTPGPQRPGETTPFTLSWQAASDNVTPSSLIVYDVYLAVTPGGENFATPNWTTAPGATTFRTPGLPSHGSFYFVVRARDSAGNEDRNRIEVRGSDPCL